ncbi:MAG: hypothetical protein Q4F95_06740 [Oscillospiraceae bacterium]|nr:hypothetical protein [Oscillospiraceae bacterium]
MKFFMLGMAVSIIIIVIVIQVAACVFNGSLKEMKYTLKEVIRNYQIYESKITEVRTLISQFKKDTEVMTKLYNVAERNIKE